MTISHTLSAGSHSSSLHLSVSHSLLKDSNSETYLLGPREMMGTLPPTHRRGSKVTFAIISSSIQTLNFQWLPSKPLAWPTGLGELAPGRFSHGGFLHQPPSTQPQ